MLFCYHSDVLEFDLAIFLLEHLKVQFRFLALIAKLFSITHKVALEIQRSNSLIIIDVALWNTKDSQDKLKVLKVIYEVGSMMY